MSIPTTTQNQKRIPRRQRDAIIQSLRAGVVPRIGQQHIQVGRDNEVTALLTDIDRIADGGAAIRFVIGEYGAGKSFFLNLVRSMALERKLVTLHADLSPDHRLHSSGGHARSLYAELMRNASTRAKPDGGAIQAILERFITQILKTSSDQKADPKELIHERLEGLQELAGGYDFAEVIGKYWEGHDTGDMRLKSDSVRWLRGEFRTRTDARLSLGVRTIVDDGNYYDHLKLFARFVRHAGFGGVLICLDEMVNLYKLTNSIARKSNYEQLLRILNDGLQGTAEGMGFAFGCTPEMLIDGRRGIYSYEALRSRLAENAFTKDGIVDYASPVLRLANLTPEEMYVLLRNLRHVFASGQENDYLVPDEALMAFMRHCAERIGDAYFRTPRATIKEFVNLLSVLEQNPDTEWEGLVGRVELAPETNPDLQPIDDEEPSLLVDGELAELVL